MSSYRYNHTHLTSKDPDKSVEFYTKVMGAKITEVKESRGQKVVTVDLGGLSIRITGRTGADNAWKGLRFGLHHLGLLVSNMEESIAELKSKGAELIAEPVQSRPGVKTAFIKAPDDVLFEIQEIKES